MSVSHVEWVDSITPEDQKLIDAYAEIGVPVDRLPYTEEYDELLRKAGLELNNETRRETFRRLTNLRKRSRLPIVVYSLRAGS